MHDPIKDLPKNALPLPPSGVESPFDSVLPPGDPGGWTQDQWAEYNDTLDELSEETAKKVDDAVQDRMEWYAAKDLADKDHKVCVVCMQDRLNCVCDDHISTVKSIHDMTDDEYIEWIHGDGWFDDGLDEAKKDDKKDEVVKVEWDDETIRLCGDKEPWKKWVRPTEPCHLINCDGPGSEVHKWDTHLAGCPWHYDYGMPESLKSKSFSYTPSCKHDRDEFKLDNDRSVYVSAWRDVKYYQDERIDVGVYLASSTWSSGTLVSAGLDVPWAPARTTHGVYIDWPDFGVPDDDVPVVEIVTWVLAQMAEGVTFEVGCLGAHGRTGTFVAMLLCAQGVTPPLAIERVRKDHCEKAIENGKQGEYVAEFYKTFHGEDSWRKSKALRKKFKKLVGAGHKNYTPFKTTPQSGGYSGSTGVEVWNKELQAWTSSSWKVDFIWNGEHKIYVKKGGEST